MASDTSDLEDAIGAIDSIDDTQETALDDRTLLTADKVRAANTLYDGCLTVQNAARLQYPSTKPGTEAARRRFLLDEFPPRDRSQPDGGTGGSTGGSGGEGGGSGAPSN